MKKPDALMRHNYFKFNQSLISSSKSTKIIPLKITLFKFYQIYVNRTLVHIFLIYFQGIGFRMRNFSLIYAKHSLYIIFPSDRFNCNLPPALMLLVNDKKQNKEVKKGFKISPIKSPRLNSFKIAYRNNRQTKLISLFENMVVENQNSPDQQSKLVKTVKPSKTTKSSYQLYKEKQRTQKQKLQEIHTLQKPKLKLDQLYSTLRVRESRTQKRLPKKLSETFELGTLNSVRSQMHDRDESKKQQLKSSRECHTQHLSRKFALPRKYSVDTNVSMNKFTIRKNNFNGNHEFHGPCRPWSPADFLQHSALITQENLTIS